MISFEMIRPFPEHMQNICVWDFNECNYPFFYYSICIVWKLCFINLLYVFLWTNDELEHRYFDL